MFRWSREQKNIIFAAGVILLFLTAPLYMDYLPAGNKLGIYFLETEGIRGPFLWILTLFCRLGISIQGSLKIYLFVAALASIVTAWYCFVQISKNSYASLAGCLCYNFSVYSVYIRYCKASLGEVTAFVFLPLAVCGMYLLYAEEGEKEQKLKGGYLLGAGIWGTFMSCVPLGMVATGFVLLAAILLWKKTFHKSRLLVFGGALLLSIDLSLGVLIPYVREMFAGRVYADTAGGSSFAERGLLPAQVLLPFVGSSTYEAGEVIRTEYMSLGLPFLAILIAWCAILFLGKKEEWQKEKRVVKFLMGLSIAAVWMSMRIFPWGKLQALHWLPNAILEHVGYPYRFLLVAVLLLSAAVSLLGKLVWEKGRKAMAVFFVAVTLTNVFSGVYLMDALLYTTEQSHSYEPDASYLEEEYLFYMSE